MGVRVPAALAADDSAELAERAGLDFSSGDEDGHARRPDEASRTSTRPASGSLLRSAPGTEGW
jgi:hypothetical protein